MRSVEAIIDDHLRLRREGRLEEDLECNYAPDAVLLTVNSNCSGRDAIRTSAHRLANQIPEGKYEYLARKIHRWFALLIWRGQSFRNDIIDGADSFVVEDERIAFQSIHYRLTPPDLDHPS